MLPFETLAQPALPFALDSLLRRNPGASAGAAASRSGAGAAACSAVEALRRRRRLARLRGGWRCLFAGR